MKKKNVLMMTMSLAMVGVVAVGGTLAYLTSSTKTLTNTFTVGQGYDANDFLLDETDVITGADDTVTNPTVISTTAREESTNEYAPVTPGSYIAKDPTFYLKADAPESWVVAKVDGVDNLVDTGDIVVATATKATITDETASALNTTYWKKVANTDGGTTTINDDLDGYYIYTGSYVYSGVTKRDYKSLEPLFTSVYVKSNVTALTEISAALQGENKIVVKGVAIQKANTTEADAVSVAKNKLQ